LQHAKAVGAWFRKAQPWLEDAQPAADIGVVYGPPLEGAVPVPVANAVSDGLARAGVFSRWIAADQPLPVCRAIVVPPQSRLDERLIPYVKDGGALIAIGSVGRLANIFGVKVNDAVRFAKNLQAATVRVDSEYNSRFNAFNLLDDNPDTVWASLTPMPHWAEITLPESVEVQTVELVSRLGYLMTDVDIELPEGDGWRIAKSVRGAEKGTVSAKLDTPVKTDRVRVKILRGLYRGADYQIAQVEAIRVFDHVGRNRASGKGQPVRVVGSFGESALPPAAVAVAPTSAEVLARFDRSENAPAILRNKVGKGQALLVTCTAVPDDGQFWANLCKLTLGEPSFIVSAKDAARFRFILTRVGDARVLHVIDAAVPAANYQPAVVEISLAAQQLGGRNQAMLAGGDKALTLSEKEGRLHFTVQPNPVATVVMKRAKR
jgi:hypothetical protein